MDSAPCSSAPFPCASTPASALSGTLTSVTRRKVSLGRSLEIFTSRLLGDALSHLVSMYLFEFCFEWLNGLDELRNLFSRLFSLNQFTAILSLLRQFHFIVKAIMMCASLEPLDRMWIQKSWKNELIWYTFVSKLYDYWSENVSECGYGYLIIKCVSFSLDVFIKFFDNFIYLNTSSILYFIWTLQS